MKKCLKKRNSGFTILEVVTVLAILGIISALAVSTISINIDNTKRDEQLTVLKAHLRYAQARAMNSDSEWGITFNADNYWLFEGADIVKNRRRFPGISEEDEHIGEAKSVSLIESGLTIVSNNIVVFNTLGSPIGTEGDDIIIETSGKDITITANTGFIYLID